MEELFEESKEAQSLDSPCEKFKDSCETKPRIIIVEDSHLNMEMLKSLVRELDLTSQCDFCYDGQ